EEGPAKEELHAVELALEAASQVQELARIVPVVERVVNVDPLVALKADQPRPGSPCERLRELGLPDPASALARNRPPHSESGEGEPVVGHIALAAKRRPDVGDRLKASHLGSPGPLQPQPGRRSPPAAKAGRREHPLPAGSRRSPTAPAGRPCSSPSSARARG